VSVRGVTSSGWLKGRVVVRAARERERCSVIERILTDEIVRHGTSREQIGREERKYLIKKHKI
jgi:hypothetical protein